MTHSNPSDTGDFDPNRLFDTLLAKLQLENDAALSSALTVAQSVISQIRSRQLPIGGLMLLRMQEVSELSISELRDLMGDRRNKCRLSISQYRPACNKKNAAARNGHTHQTRREAITSPLATQENFGASFGNSNLFF